MCDEMEDKYPYQTYYSVIDDVMLRDNYTCQICGHYGVLANHVVVTRCLECEKKGIYFEPLPDWNIPKPCREKGIKFRTCGECPQFKEISIEYVSYANLVVHHKDGKKTNQNLDNLVTVCTSCHRRLHKRGKILSIDEVKENLRTSRTKMKKHEQGKQ
jgi:5-methylcytosine-specific restriction endonuclease McrA